MKISPQHYQGIPRVTLSLTKGGVTLWCSIVNNSNYEVLVEGITGHWPGQQGPLLPSLDSANIILSMYGFLKTKRFDKIRK